MFDVGFTPGGSFLATASTDGTARFWEAALPCSANNSATAPGFHGLDGRDLTRWPLAFTVETHAPPSRGPPVFDLEDLAPDPRIKPDELQSWSELVACQRIHETGNIENLASAQWLARWKACRHLRTEQPPNDWSPQSQADWHDRQALAFFEVDDRKAILAPRSVDRAAIREIRRSPGRENKAYEKVGQPGKAITDLRAAIDLDPADESAWISRGLAELDLGQVDAAIADFNKALELVPEHWVAAAAQPRDAPGGHARRPRRPPVADLSRRAGSSPRSRNS